MIVEHPRSLLVRKIAAHAFLIGFICLILGPFLVVVSISFREGNFTIGSLWPEHPTLEHWYLAFGIPFTRPDGTIVQPPYPVLLWLWNSIKIGLIASLGVVAISTISAYAFSRVKFPAKRADTEPATYTFSFASLPRS